MKVYLVSLALFMLTFGNAAARPVSYSGGSTVMQINDAITNSLHLHYSPSYRYSVGYKLQNLRVNNVVLHGAQLNYLAKRWNQKESQGNVYIKMNVGNAYRSGDNAFYGSLGVAADFETRRYFISYANNYWQSKGNMLSMFSQKARIGVAPYVANYGHLHTWLMLQVQHQPKYDGSEQVITTPMVRFFKGPHLVELGLSSNKRVLFNFIARF